MTQSFPVTLKGLQCALQGIALAEHGIKLVSQGIVLVLIPPGPHTVGVRQPTRQEILDGLSQAAHEDRIVFDVADGVAIPMLDHDGQALVMVGVRPDEPASAAVGAVVRELCYPAVRRAVAPYETGFDDRATLSDVSDLLATRCGARVVANVRPEWLDAYTTRFGDRGIGTDFLSAAGYPPDVTVLERTLDQALEAIAAGAAQVEQYKGGNEKVLGWFVGQVMKATQGKADGKVVGAESESLALFRDLIGDE